MDHHTHPEFDSCVPGQRHGVMRPDKQCMVGWKWMTTHYLFLFVMQDRTYLCQKPTYACRKPEMEYISLFLAVPHGIPHIFYISFFHINHILYFNMVTT